MHGPRPSAEIAMPASSSAPVKAPLVNRPVHRQRLPSERRSAYRTHRTKYAVRFAPPSGADTVSDLQRDDDWTVISFEAPADLLHGGQPWQTLHVGSPYAQLDGGGVPDGIPIDTILARPIVHDVATVGCALDLAPTGRHAYAKRTKLDDPPSAGRPEAFAE